MFPVYWQLSTIRLTEGSDLEHFKLAVVASPLRKEGFNPDDLGNFWTISNVSLISEMLEWLVNERLNDKHPTRSTSVLSFNVCTPVITWKERHSLARELSSWTVPDGNICWSNRSSYIVCTYITKTVHLCKVVQWGCLQRGSLSVGHSKPICHIWWNGVGSACRLIRHHAHEISWQILSEKNY